LVARRPDFGNGYNRTIGLGVPQFVNSCEEGRGSEHQAEGRRRLAGIAATCALIAGALLSGCVAQRTEVDKLAVKPEIVKSAVRFQKEYILFAGDQIEVSVWRVPEVSRTVTIGPDGKISLPLLQDVQASGLTARELAEKLKSLYSTRLLNPEVTVISLAVRQPVVYVLGDVKNPLAVPYRNAPTALQAIGLAGGLLRSTAESDVTIIRLSSDGFLMAIPIDSEAGGQPGPYMGFGLAKLEPDDIVFVPESNRSQAVRFMNEFVFPATQLALTYKLFQQY
jgi:polysaccharide export outer membrane protein